MNIVAIRDHSFDAGHRVHGHESRCARVHGHTYLVELHCSAHGLDELGRVIDFGVIKSLLCRWIDEYWDHRMILWESDPLCLVIHEADPEALFMLPYNPTAENLARYLLEEVGPVLLKGSPVRLTKVVMHETRKCRAEASL